MDTNQDDKTTARHMAITFVAFSVLCVVMIVGAHIIAG
jgi:hypothetical protein